MNGKSPHGRNVTRNAYIFLPPPGHGGIKAVGDALLRGNENSPL
jgi:hypothetical protein